MGLFSETECSHCGGKDHASSDCPHSKGFFGLGAETECRHCGSKEHSSEECPHSKGFFGLGAEMECRHCGAKDHASDDCPHSKGFFGLGAETECRHCGSDDHSSDQCPHSKGFFGLGAEMECRHCGSNNHASDECPHEHFGRTSPATCERCGSRDHAAEKCPQNESEPDGRRADDSAEWLGTLVGWMVGICFAIWLLIMAVAVAVVLSPIWLGAVAAGGIAGFVLADRAARKLTAEALAGVPVEQAAGHKPVRRVATHFVAAGIQPQYHLLALVLVTAGYGALVALRPFGMAHDGTTQALLVAACVIGCVLGTLSGRRVFLWQYENRLLRRLHPGGEASLVAPMVALGFCIPGLMALVGFWSVTLAHSGNRFEIFSSSTSAPRNAQPTVSLQKSRATLTSGKNEPRTLPQPLHSHTPAVAPVLPKPYSQASPAQSSAVWPGGLVLIEESLSPDRRLGVLAPNFRLFKQGEPRGQNLLVEVPTKRVLASLDAESYYQDPAMTMNQMSAVASWSANAEVLAWIIGGKWSVHSFNLLKVTGATVEWQVDVLAAAQREILIRTRAIAPDAYERAKKENAGNGSAFPEGFVVDMTVPKNGFSLPQTYDVTLDSNPKGIEGRTNLRSTLELTVGTRGELSFANAALQSPANIPHAVTPMATSPDVEHFVRERVRTETTRDITRILQHYADRVSYWKHGEVDRDFIRTDKEDYFHRWPITYEELVGPVQVSAKPLDWHVEFQTRFRVENPVSGVSIQGRQSTQLILRLVNGALRITAEHGEVLEKQRQERALADIPPPPRLESMPGERFPETRLTQLSVQTLRKFSMDELRYAINEMFARHGADFANQDLKRQFSRFAWYTPRPDLDFDAVEERFFSPLERQNLKLLGEARKAAAAQPPTETQAMTPSGPAPTSGKSSLRPGAKARIVTARDLKNMVGQRVNDTWFYGSFIASRASGSTVVMYPIRAGGLLRDYGTEVHATFRSGVFPFSGRERLPMDPIDSNVGVQIDQSKPLKITSITRATKSGTSKVIVVVRAEQ